jgi:hypothetical protein
MLYTLISAFPETGYQLYQKLDYWECRDLLEISTSGKVNPGDKLQSRKNDDFNSFLDKIAYDNMTWQFLPSKYNLWGIKTQTERLGDEPAIKQLTEELETNG